MTWLNKGAFEGLDLNILIVSYSMDKDERLNSIVHTILTEADKINTTLNILHSKFIAQNSTVQLKVTDALKALEHALEIVVRNTDMKTNKVNGEVFNDLDRDQLLAQLQHIGILSRRLERETKEYFRNLDNE